MKQRKNNIKILHNRFVSQWCLWKFELMYFFVVFKKFNDILFENNDNSNDWPNPKTQIAKFFRCQNLEDYIFPLRFVSLVVIVTLLRGLVEFFFRSIDIQNYFLDLSRLSFETFIFKAYSISYHLLLRRILVEWKQYN